MLEKKLYSIFVLEGIEGSGKTSVAELLKKAYRTDSNIVVKESKYGLLTSKELLTEDTALLGEEIGYLVTEVLRTQEVANLVDDGKIIIMDRGWLSTRIYGLLRSELISPPILPSELWMMQHLLLQDLFRSAGNDISKKIITIYFEVDTKLALKHLSKDRQKRIRSAKINEEWLVKAQSYYEEAFEKSWAWAGKPININTNEKSLKKIAKECMNIIKEFRRR